MYIALGANLPSASGTPQRTLENALLFLEAETIHVVRASPWYRNPAYPPGSGPDFVNGVVRAETALGAEAVLAALHRVEARLGRQRAQRWAPRAIDLDLLAWNDAVQPDRTTLARLMALGPARAKAEPPPGGLVLPHPRLQERAFVLVPLAAIEPDWRHPVTGQGVAEMLAALPREDVAAMVPIEA
ncbi:MAG TPA: 2-amino-4-hydroxy-6-hydroxymethyldihydropteridine diphosphokinase [Paracoccaceae bacterium]|nr:2-amino-4-hydroxy-6-hydroxymethyldihydropteridine diphosphokinase [Paracoccaceae bacterium]